MKRIVVLAVLVALAGCKGSNPTTTVPMTTVPMTTVVATTVTATTLKGAAPATVRSVRSGSFCGDIDAGHTAISTSGGKHVTCKLGDDGRLRWLE